MKRRSFNDRVNIVDHFLEIFRYQLGEEHHAPAKFSLVDPHDRGPDYVYELKIKRGSKWAKRRMTISALAEDSGSKSRCFKVIYDNLLVIKIPPAPVGDFRKYIDSIKTESRVSLELAPEVQFVAPMVSALLKSIHKFPDRKSLSPSELESRYLIWLDVNPEFQKYLKINDQFVFVMDLSTQIFLANAIQKMHDKKTFRENVRNEIRQSSDVLNEPIRMSGRFGMENEGIYSKIDEIFTDFKNRTAPFLEKHRLEAIVTEFNFQNWFLSHLADNADCANEDELPDEFMDGMNAVLRKIMLENAGNAAAFRKTIEDSVSERLFIQNRPRMSGIITNMLSLLAWLWEKGLSIRDLKPDNMFVACDPEAYPIILATPEEYSLGLIDFETSVRIDKNRPDFAMQPLLGGTPIYATPSHVFTNDLLKNNFKNLPLVLHLQDWHAVTGMIYKVVTGQDLFVRTGKLIRKIMNMRRQFMVNKIPLDEVFYYGSRIFWSSAADEFKEKMRLNEKLLRAVPVVVPENAREALLNEVRKNKSGLAHAMRKYIKSQNVFVGEKSRQFLIRASQKEIRRYKRKWKDGNPPVDAPAAKKSYILKILANLEELKSRYQHQGRLHRMLDNENPRISAYELAEIFFNTVLTSMYKEKWGKLSAEEPKPPETENASDGMTVMVEETAESQSQSTIVYDDTIGIEG